MITKMINKSVLNSTSGVSDNYLFLFNNAKNLHFRPGFIASSYLDELGSPFFSGLFISRTSTLRILFCWTNLKVAS